MVSQVGGVTPRKRASVWSRIRRDKYLLLMLLPVMAYYVIFCYGPMYGTIIAFKEYNMFKGIMASPWIGMKNFLFVFGQAGVYNIIKNTLVLNLLTLAFGFPGPILLALLLNELTSTKFKRTIQTIVYLPHFLSWVVVVMILGPLLSTSTGMVNRVLNAVFGFKINFLGVPGWWIFTYVLLDVWKGVGWGAIIYLSALTGIDPSLYEAATIDGAGRLKQCWYVTLPGIAPTITILLIMRLGNMASIGFDEAYLLGNDQISNVSDIISTYVYRIGVVKAEYSRTAAIGLAQSAVNVVMLVTANAIARRVTGSGLF